MCCQSDILEVLEIVHRKGSVDQMLAILKWSEELALAVHKQVLLSNEQFLPACIRAKINAHRAERSYSRCLPKLYAEYASQQLRDKWGVVCGLAGDQLIGGSSVAMYNVVLRTLWIQKHSHHTKPIFQRMILVPGRVEETEWESQQEAGVHSPGKPCDMEKHEHDMLRLSFRETYLHGRRDSLLHIGGGFRPDDVMINLAMTMLKEGGHFLQCVQLCVSQLERVEFSPPLPSFVVEFCLSFILPCPLSSDGD